MRRVIGWLLLITALGLAAVAVVSVLARFHDGPLGPFPGGPFEGPNADALALRVDDAAGKDTVEIEVGDPPLSRTTWIVGVNGALYVPAGEASYKKWPAEAESTGHMRVRIDGQVYPFKATRVTDPAALSTLLKAVGSKYDLSGSEDGAMAKSTWFFRLDPVTPKPLS